MTREDWANFLRDWALAAVARESEDTQPGPLSGLGNTGASDDLLDATELRISAHLPSSYRSFLQCTNGLRQPGSFMPARGGDFLPAQQIDWFRLRNQDWIDAWMDACSGTLPQLPSVPDHLYFRYGTEQDASHLRVEYLCDCLEISENGDSAVYLLNPRVIGQDGEWEAWFFANWHAGACRYRSFAELMRSHHHTFLSSKIGGF